MTPQRPEMPSAPEEAPTNEQSESPSVDSVAPSSVDAAVPSSEPFDQPKREYSTVAHNSSLFSRHNFNYNRYVNMLSKKC